MIPVSILKRKTVSFKRIKHFFDDPEYWICKGLLRFMKPEFIPDRLFLKYQFHYVFGQPLNLDNPKSFNEKLQWLKLYDRNPLYTTLVDKYAVKKWVADKIGKEYVIPTLAIYDNEGQIDLNTLPNQFVLKCTHDSGSVVICKDKRTFDLDGARQVLGKGLKNNFYKKHREWPYKNVQRRIIAEQFLDDNSSSGLKDFKLYCMNGECKAILVVTRNHNTGNSYYDYFDADFNHLSFTKGHPNSPCVVARPESFSVMKQLSQRLSEGITNVRCDFYEINGRIFFGEMTFFPASGIVPFNPVEYDIEWGGWIELPSKNR